MSHIVVAGPIAGDDVRAYLAPSSAALPPGYGGAPLTGVLIGELLAMGHRVTAITTDSSLAIDAEPARRDGAGFQFVVCPARLRAWRFNGRHPGRALDFFALERRGIEQEIRRAAPDLVHVHWSYEFALAALNTPFPHLITCHDSPAAVLKFTRSPYRALRYLMAMRVFRAGVHFTTVSKYMQTQLSTVLRKPVAIVPNPVSSQVLSLGRARERPRTRKVAMVCNGWHRLKNPEPGLHAFAAWRQGEPGAELHLFGVDFGWGERAQRKRRAWTQAHSGCGCPRHPARSLGRRPAGSRSCGPEESRRSS